LKTGLHPEYKEVVITCACGASYQTRSTRHKNFTVEICSNCHPHYTGRERATAAKGRVERFKRKYKDNKPS
jgi:large subunit ribosomal protein L31